MKNSSESQVAPVVLFQYDREWNVLFKKEKDAIQGKIGKYILSIDHIGSTAIEGALAKPEIDILIGLENLGAADNCVGLLEKIGYSYFQRFEEFVPERRYFRRSNGIIPLFHIHMVQRNSAFWKDCMNFRNYLRDNPTVLEEYSNLKKELLLACGGDRKKYSEAKKDFISSILL